MTPIERLENEIDKKINALNESLNAQYLLCETLKNNIKTLVMIEKQLKDINISNNTINRLKP